MAKPQRFTYLKATLEDRPGRLLSIMEDLKRRKLGLNGLWGFSKSEGKADLFVVPKDPQKVREAWKAAGILVEEGEGLFLRGADKTGALLKSLKAIADAGVNINAINGIAVGGYYGSFVWVGSDQLAKAASALGAK